MYLKELFMVYEFFISAFGKRIVNLGLSCYKTRGTGILVCMSGLPSIDPMAMSGKSSGKKSLSEKYHSCTAC